MLLSIDVGIKNMAYCIFNITDNKEKEFYKNVEIIDWNVINITKGLIEEETNIIYCNQYMKNKKKCEKRAVYINNNLTKCYCEKHFKQDENIYILTNEYNKTNLIKKNIIELKQIYNELNKNENENIDKINKKEIIEKIQNFFVKKIKIKKVNTNMISMIDICINLTKQLNEILDDKIDKIKKVIIENQISPIANRMKNIQIMITQYFIMKDSKIEIEYISSKNKLNNIILEKEILKDKNKEENKNLTESQIYNIHKKEGKKYCELILKKWNEKVENIKIWKEKWDNNKNKKDDLSDSLLQGIWYINVILKYIF